VGFQQRLKVVTQDDAHIYPPKGVGLHQHSTDAKSGRYVAGAGRVPPASHDQRGVDQRISVPEKNHVKFLPAEHARRRASGSLPPGAVQHLDRDATLWDDLGKGGSTLGFWFCRQQEGRCEEEYHHCRYGDFGPVATRLFQKRRVRS
jgi:hypothetical protein